MDASIQFFLAEQLSMLDTAPNDRLVDDEVAFMRGALEVGLRCARMTTTEHATWLATVRRHAADRKTQLVGIHRLARGAS